MNRLRLRQLGRKTIQPKNQGWARPKFPMKPPEVKPLGIEPQPKPATREQPLKELEELHRSGRIAETAYRRLKRKYEAEGN